MTGNGKSHICPVDGRRFATKAALRQHREASHAVVAGPTRGMARGRGGGRPGRGRGGRSFGTSGAPRVPRPLLGLSAMRNAQQGICPSSGSDIIGAITYSSKTKMGDIMFDWPINPLSFPGSRLAMEAALWTRWRPTRLVVEIGTGAPAMCGGQYGVGWTSDPTFKFVKGQNLVATVAALRPSVISHVANGQVISLPVQTSQRWLYCTSHDIEDSAQGRLLIACVAPLSAVSGSISLTVKLGWTVHFSGPVIPTITTEEAYYADDGWENYFTDSISDWANGKCLTLKMHQGGSAVRFSTMRVETVYRLDKSAKLNYYVDATNTDSIKYGVRIPNYAGGPAIAVFKDKSRATSFASSGNEAYCLPFFKAGDYVTPSNPAWFLEASESLDSVVELRREVAELRRALDAVRLSGGPSVLPMGMKDDVSETSSFLEVERSSGF